MEDELFPRMAGAGRAIVGFRHHGYWADVGNPVAYLRTNLDLLRGAVPEMLPALLPDGWPRVGAGARRRRGQRHSRVCAAPRCSARAGVVGEGASLEEGVVAGADCSIGADAHVASSVLWDGAAVGAGARVVRSVLASGARVGAGAVLEGAVLGHGAEVAAGERPPPATALEPDGVYRDGSIVAATADRRSA